MMLRVFLFDDHPVVRNGLKGLIDAQPDMRVVGEADDGSEPLATLRAANPDLVVMDLSMPTLSGADATRHIKAAFPELKVLGLSAHEDRGYAQLLLDAGASGFVLKRAAADDLVRAIRAVASGGMYIDPSVTSELVAVRRRTEANGLGPLSERETEVLRLIAQGHSIKETAATLDLGVRTIETYRARGMEKLKLKSRADLVRYALRSGWLKDF